MKRQTPPHSSGRKTAASHSVRFDKRRTTTRATVGQSHGHHHAHYQIPPNAEKYVKAFRPIQYMLTLVGQFPAHSQYIKEDGTYSYRASWYTPGFYFFILALLVQSYLILTMLYNTVSIFTGRDYLRNQGATDQTKLYDLVLVARYRHVFITIWVNILCAFGAQLRILFRLRYFEDYFGYWTRATQIHHLDVGEGMWKFTFCIMGVYTVYISTLITLYVLEFSPSFRAVPSLMALMMFKCYTPDIFKFDDKTENEIYVRSPLQPYLRTYQHAGAVSFLFILIWSKSFIIIFLFKCKLLINAFVIFNQRVYTTIIKGKSHHAKRGLISVHVLFKDHCCMLDLLEGTDNLFSSIFEPFLGLHVAGLLHELYYFLLNTGQQTAAEAQTSFDGNYFPRPHDYVRPRNETQQLVTNAYSRKVKVSLSFFQVFSAMMTFQTLFCLIYVSRVAINVGEQAMDGLEVLRRKAMIGRESDDELFFHFSMFQSYSGRKDGCFLRCGSFFTLNKQLITGIFVTFLGYFIVLQQFHPTFEYVPQVSTAVRSEELTQREKIGKFLYRVENLAYCHWVSGPSESCPLFPT